MAASTSSRITIDAPRANVMAVIADFAAYPQWASAVRAAEKPEDDGAMQLDAGQQGQEALVQGLQPWGGERRVAGRNHEGALRGDRPLVGAVVW